MRDDSNRRNGEARNRLDSETSPYLLQHASNPVHWWAWGPEALAEAQQTGKPILLSVGYAACHWCHVMAHESFENAATAALMNELFVNIKVDREERPDIDAIYMSALHKLGERGGWPLTMFLDSAARPFWGGTYFPKDSRHGLPSFKDVLNQVAKIYREAPGKVSQNAEAIMASLAGGEAASGHGVRFSDQLLADVTSRMSTAVDPLHGGIKGAPKFPQWSFFWLMWRGAMRYGQQDNKRAVLNSLTNICQGGIYDHLRGGFARYSVDERWLAPHFEKMLYDNALLICLLTEAFRETGDPLYRQRIEQTVAWLEAEMIAEGGGFASSLDADSEGVEGKFYVWSRDEIVAALGKTDASLFCEVYDVTQSGNWEGTNILNRLQDLQLRCAEDEARLSAMRDTLLARRAARVWPGWDDKVLADWNGLMIAALAHASRVLQRPKWLAMAEKAFAFVKMSMTHEQRLKHAYRAGESKAPATASDYANMIWAALALYQTTGAPAYLATATGWTEVLDEHYWDEPAGGYAFTADDTPDVIVRLKNAHDDATPNANGIMMSNLSVLFLLTGKSHYRDKAEQIANAFSAELAANLMAHGGLIASAFDMVIPQHIVVIGKADDADAAALLNEVYSISLPGAVEQTVRDTTQLPVGSPLSGKKQLNDKATAYVCIGPQCSLPINDPQQLKATLLLQRLGGA